MKDYKVRITNTVYFLTLRKRELFILTRSITRFRVFYVHDITVILRYFFEKKNLYEKEILLMKTFKISFSEMKYNVVIYYRRHLSEGKYGYRCMKIKLFQIICFYLFFFLHEIR